MQDSLMRWLGWLTVVLLVLGAMASFFHQAGRLDAMLEGANMLMLQDDVYRSDLPVVPAPLSGYVADTEDMPIGDVAPGAVSRLENGFSEIVGPMAIQSLWLHATAGQAHAIPVFLDDIPLRDLMWQDVAVPARYRLSCVTTSSEEGYVMRFSRLVRNPDDTYQLPAR